MPTSDPPVIFFGGEEYFHVEKYKKLQWLQKYFFAFWTTLVGRVPTLTAILGLFPLAPETRYPEKPKNRRIFFSLKIFSKLSEKFNQTKWK